MVVLFVMHHPPVADLQTVKLVDRNARPDEQALAFYLKTVAAHSLAQDGVTYLVSGGGGATTYDIDRPPEDLYRGMEFSNYHYVRFEDYAAANPSHWRVKDKFELTLQP